MNFLRKILLIAIALVFVGNAEGARTVFDLPPDTPGLQQQNQNQDVNGISTLCKHVIVPRTEAAANGTNARNFDGNIYFPIDGHQPTTEEAAKYSCANVGAYDEHSPVTEWYMQMFGLGASPIRAGYSFCSAASVKKSTQEAYQDLLNFTKGINLEEQRKIFSDLCKSYEVTAPIIIVKESVRLFEQTFRTIAADPVGRVLLYRLLIEIRRYASRHRLFGISEVANIKTEDIITRNHNRSIVIKNGDYSHSTLNRCICFNVCSELEKLPELCVIRQEKIA